MKIRNLPATKAVDDGVDLNGTSRRRSPESGMFNTAARRSILKDRMRRHSEYALMSLSEVEGLLGVTRRCIYDLEKRGDFPQRVKISHQKVGYKIGEIYAWIDARQASNAPPSEEAVSRARFIGGQTADRAGP